MLVLPRLSFLCPKFKHLDAPGYLCHLRFLINHALLKVAHLSPLLANELLLLTSDCLRSLKLVKKLLVVAFEPLIVLRYLQRLIYMVSVSFELEVEVLITLL